MKKGTPATAADFYFEKDSRWQKEVVILRKLLLDCGLQETVKWGTPCYTFEENNIVLIHDFKEYCALLFFKGALLNDPDGILIQQTKQVQSARQVRITGTKDITTVKAGIKALVFEAIEAERAGLKVPLKKTADYEVPVEFQQAMDKSQKLNKAFSALTPGRQRGYLLFFGAAKQSATRIARIEKNIPRILRGEGLND